MRARTAVSLIVLAAFMVAARGAGNLYPLSRFPMYSAEQHQGAASRVMVRVDGDWEEVTHFSSYDCEALPALDTTFCEGTAGIPYVDREREEYIRAHPGGGPLTVELARRVFSFDGQPRAPFCVITTCKVAP